MRFEYTQEQENKLRTTEIEAILENNLYADDNERYELMAELLLIGE